MDEDLATLCAQCREHLSRNESPWALAKAERALKKYAEEGNKKGEGYALFLKTLALAGLPGADPEDTAEFAQNALMAVQDLGDAECELELLQAMVGVKLRAKQHTSALQTAKDVVRKLREGGDTGATARACRTVAEVCVRGEAPDDGFQAAREALDLFTRSGDQAGQGSCHLLLADLHLKGGEVDDALDAAMRARQLARDSGDVGGEAGAVHREALCHRHNGEHIEALRASERASKLWQEIKDKNSEVDALVMQAEAKMNICEANATLSTWPTIVNMSKFALKCARQYRADDLGCLGSALYTHARVLLKTNSFKGAWLAAKESVKVFRKQGNTPRMAHALVLWAVADLQGGCFKDARTSCDDSLAIFERLGGKGEDGRSKALEVDEQIDRALGIPTRAELEEQQRQYMLQQQQFMMQQQMMMGGGGGAGQPQGLTILPLQHQQEQMEQQAASAGREFKRDGASPIALSAGMDPAIVKAKVLDLAGQIIGDTDEVELDTPLMEAGLTSNSAVLLRDELSKDLPGINLPPTLIFDYPSVGAISDFVIEKSKQIK